MTSTELKIGMTSSARPSSRVLKPPGGGHTNIFSEPETAVPAPRPKYNQQNSSNLNACMGSTDPNKVVEKLRDEITSPKEETKTTANSQPKESGNKPAATNGEARGRVPPGGFSSGGFW
ncbi:GL11943 [Drosophila persimilis]|uniref:Jupiter microtubule associated homolog 2 n=2 Tax=pseudoobscura subgroup TaxID=32358 RepID=A0A6I8VCK1_DROPS|nr:jupiter microtubule associated homolog 2 [Drosophila pseudoobscura]XP_002019941.1 jupiter microtubule associated homolog 2 [Drosophila persimilis]XP_015038435.1 jupiter microtubule associated homolog 2 [Drosophila pseudoobscura]XP_015038436.1 jupiter microtubule associated homolog 2 [Drosophila pseudoobscura]XP_017143620.1 jupiter microtubule associated homolog 2 [Drosophila miranda]EDW38575.1 GL11943 [Drosophila persimilis]